MAGISPHHEAPTARERPRHGHPRRLERQEPRAGRPRVSLTSTSTATATAGPSAARAPGPNMGVSGARRLTTFTPPPVRGVRREPERFLTTVLMTDIVDSTRTAARLGDRRWCELLVDHFADCRARIERTGGALLDTAGDGILAIFGGPTHAVRAAIAIQQVAREHLIGVRAGVHTGECERMGTGIAGVAVHIAARICALADADEVMTTGTVRDLVLGSDLAFEARGVRLLRGVPGEWAVFRATDVCRGPDCS
jgi:class 3 adenylate cyclase